MSFIDLLFPLEELEALGNKWPGPPSKRRKLDLNAGLAQGQQLPRKQGAGSSADQRRHTLSTSSYQSSKASSLQAGHSTIKRSNSDIKPYTTSTTSLMSTQMSTAAKSCLPNFIEPSLLKNYLHHLHPNDRSRYSIANSPEPENVRTSLGVPRRPSTHHEHEESACSPASLTTDTSSSTESTDNCPTPPAGIYDQLRASPFGHLIHGLRLTEHERDLVEDLLSPSQTSPPPYSVPRASTSIKRKAATLETEIHTEDFQHIDRSLLQRMFPPQDNNVSSELDYFNTSYKDSDVHSSGLSPASQDQEEEEKQLEATKEVSTRGFAISVDDFFDLDEASDFAHLTAA